MTSLRAPCGGPALAEGSAFLRACAVSNMLSPTDPSQAEQASWLKNQWVILNLWFVTTATDKLAGFPSLFKSRGLILWLARMLNPLKMSQWGRPWSESDRFYLHTLGSAVSLRSYQCIWATLSHMSPNLKICLLCQLSRDFYQGFLWAQKADLELCKIQEHNGAFLVGNQNKHFPKQSPSITLRHLVLSHVMCSWENW